MSGIIQLEHLKYSYHADQVQQGECLPALQDINLSVQPGEFISILGRNGSGKSTLARMINALFVPTEGVCYIGGMDTRDSALHWEIRKICGMVFQNPDNQIIGTSVEEDVAFGLENIGVPPLEIRDRIDSAMQWVGIYEQRENPPNMLSGGQKQRVAIAGILAMHPECIVLDESTAMLDPLGRKEVMSAVRELNQKFGITVLHITHHMEEAVLSDRVLVMDQGQILLDGVPRAVFSNVSKLKSLGLEVPPVTELVHRLIAAGYVLPPDILTVEEAAEYLSAMIRKEQGLL